MPRRRHRQRSAAADQRRPRSRRPAAQVRPAGAGAAAAAAATPSISTTLALLVSTKRSSYPTASLTGNTGSPPDAPALAGGVARARDHEHLAAAPPRRGESRPRPARGPCQGRRRVAVMANDLPLLIRAVRALAALLPAVPCCGTRSPRRRGGDAVEQHDAATAAALTHHVRPKTTAR